MCVCVCAFAVNQRKYNVLQYALSRAPSSCKCFSVRHLQNICKIFLEVVATFLQIFYFTCNHGFYGVLSIRRISIRRIPIIGLGLGIGFGLGIVFGELKFGELKRNRFLQGVSIGCYAEPCISYGRVVRPSICLSVCSSQASTVSKRRKLGSRNLH